MNLFFAILLLVPSLTLDEVEVTAHRAQVQSEAFRLVTQINHEEIETLPVMHVADILAYLPGVDVRSRGASIAQSDVSLRGGTFDQVLILINGVDISDSQTGHYAMHIPVSPALIERIEILQGTGANLTGAFAGAINIVTRETAEDAYLIQLTGGTNGEVAPVFSGSWARGNGIHINTSAAYTRSGGYYAPRANDREHEALANTAYQMADLYFQTRWRGMDVQAGAQYKDAGLGTGYGYASTDQFDATRTLLASVGYNTPVGKYWTLNARAAYRANYDRYEWHRGTGTPNRHHTHNTQAAFHAHYASSIGRTSVGMEVKDEYIHSSNMGEHNRLQATLSAEQQFLWRGMAASIGVAGHYNTWFGWYASSAANIGYSFAKTASIYLAVHRALRMPTWTDMYYQAGVQRGSADLRAEKAWQFSIGGQYTWQSDKSGALHIAGEVYYRIGEDIIDWTYNDADRLFHATNENHVNAFGFELTADYHYNRWLRDIRVRYAYSTLSLDMKQTKSQYLDYLRHKLSLHLNHGIYVWGKGCVGANWSLRWQVREGTYVDIYGTPGNTFTPVLLLDGSLYAELSHVRVAMECTNMTNRHYYDYGGVLMPGATGRITLYVKL